jgi:hypothetical protein
MNIENIKRIENLTHLAMFMYDNHKEELFTSDYEELINMSKSVIRHEALEQFDMMLEEVEVYYVKNAAMSLFTQLSINRMRN